MIKKLIIFLLLLQAIAAHVSAQKKRPLTCGTPSNFADYAQHFDKSAVTKLADGMIRIKVYVVNFNRSIYFDSHVQIPDEIARMNASFAPHNICFELIGYRSVDNFDLSVMRVDLPESVNQLHQYRMPNVVTMFIHFAMFANPNKEIGGSAYAIPNTYFSLSAKNFGNQSAAHEMGHCMGLYHTFHGNPGVEDDDGCEEFVDRSNASSCGDFVVDTRADPFGLPNARINSQCQYVVGQTDSQGDVYTNVPISNAMAYWWIEWESCLLEGFTAGQVERARLSLIPPFGPLFFYQVDQTNITYNSGEVTGNFSKGVTGTIQTAGSASYTINNATGGFTASRITLQPGTRVIITSEDRNFRIKPLTCEY